MHYHEAATFLFSLRRFRMKPGTGSARAFLEYLDDPHEGVDFVQIAGSNGKGSTARMLEQSLRETGLSVGLYTSPHLEDVRERVRIDGRKIPKSAICTFVEQTRSYITERAADGEAPTFFEAMTVLALWYFGERDVDVAVLEVGIGGRLDATSVVEPIASAVTSVSLEHTGLIGDTVEEIARDKAHVAPANGPLVTGVSGSALEAVCEVTDPASVTTVGTTDEADVRVSYEGRLTHAEAQIVIDGQTDDESEWRLETQIAALGAHQAENAGIAVTLARAITASRDGAISDEELRRGLRNAHWPGRFEVMDTAPLVVLDGAHNPGAAERLTEVLSTFAYDELHLVFAAMHDKDHRGIVEALPTPDSVIACEPALERAEDSDVLATVFERAGVEAICTTTTVTDGLLDALESAGPDDCVLVTGSLYAVSEARSRWTHTEIPKRARDLEAVETVLEGADVTSTDIDRVAQTGVHRIIKTNLPYRQATRLEQAFLRVGGSCVLSGIEREEEYVDVVLLGTIAQFEALAETFALAVDGHNHSVSKQAVDRYPWDDGPAVMGILNVTPDSFHDGGAYNALEDAVSRAHELVDAGASIVDIGGESTRPGAQPVDAETEIERVVPVIERLEASDLEATISIDTQKAVVAAAALEAGADVINDVSGLGDPEMRFVAAEYDAGVILMHSIDAPVVPDKDVRYDDVVEDVIEQLAERILLAEKAGVDRSNIVVDPGLGFGKSAPESFALLDRLTEFQALGCPILVGHSQKSMFGHVGCEPGERLEATIAATALAVDRGADIVRVHDVPENVAAVKTALATAGFEPATR